MRCFHMNTPVSHMYYMTCDTRIYTCQIKCDTWIYTCHTCVIITWIHLCHIYTIWKVTHEYTPIKKNATHEYPHAICALLSHKYTSAIHIVYDMWHMNIQVSIKMRRMNIHVLYMCYYHMKTPVSYTYYMSSEQVRSVLHRTHDRKSLSRAVAVHCSVVHCVAVCCSTVKCAKACCSVVSCVASITRPKIIEQSCCSALRSSALCCSVLQYGAVC